MQVTTECIREKIRGLIKDLQRTDGRDAFQFEGDNEFSLSENYVCSTGMKVFINDIEISEDDWTYNEETNKVIISPVTSGLALMEGDDIVIKYSYYEKYSNSELNGYIKSNLVRFSVRRYKKTFYMNDFSQVVTVNGENPSNEEGDIIAIITAIDIDPQNINVKIGQDFTVSATENKSKTEQINNIIDQFTRSFGTISFLETEKE